MKHSQPDRAVGLRMPRSRGAVSGLLLVILGVWGALIPFVGPRFNFAYTPDQDWTWTTARGWLEVFPGVTTVVGGLLLIFSANRAIAMFGGWLAVLGGAWFVVGGQFAPMLRIASTVRPVEPWISLICALISSVAFAVWLASALTLLSARDRGALISMPE